MIDLFHEQLSEEEPWPGLAWFDEVDQPFFRGRALETSELIRLVRREPLTVLFGRSGLGKTSLLKAGLFPALRREDFLPVYIRLLHAPDAPALREQVWKALAAALQGAGLQGADPLVEEELWSFLHRRDVEFWSALNRPVTPVIVFDQFEEIFTLGQQDSGLRLRSEHFLAELADLLENRPPALLKQRLEREPEAAAGYEFRRATCRLILSFREDFLAEVERLKTDMPSLMANRLRLLPMNGAQAYAVITEAGGRLVEDEVARRMIQLTWNNTPDPPVDPVDFPRLELDPALLSVVCRELNNKRREADPPLMQITAELMTGADHEILQGFYERGMAGLEPGVRHFVEEELITQQGYRDSHDWEDALLLPGVSSAGLEQLIACRLLRVEEQQGRRRLELSHDVLATVVRDSRDRRRAREAELAKSQELLAAAERLRVAETAKQLRTTRLWLSVSVVLGILLVFIGGYAYRQAKENQILSENKARRALADKREVEIQKNKLEDANQALSLQKAKAEKLAGELTNALALAAQREAEALRQQAKAEEALAEAGRQKARADALEAKLQQGLGDAVLADFLARLVKAIEEHNWDLVLTLFGEENFKFQRDDLKISKPQYIIEGLGLGFVKNNLRFAGEKGPYSIEHLNRIRQVEIGKVTRSPKADRLTVTGKATLVDGRTLDITLYLVRTITGRYEMRPPQG